MQRSEKLDLLLDEYRRKLTEEKAPDSLEDALLMRLHGAQRERAFRPWRLAAVLALCAIAGLLFRIQQSVQIEEQTAVQQTIAQKEIVTDFIPLFDNDALSPARLVRVRLNSDSLRQLGFLFGEQQLRSEGLLADVVLSEEGLPQAIRFVQEKW